VLAEVERAGPTLELDEVRAASHCAAATARAPQGPWAPGRTLWHALYFPEERRMQVDFYLGEDEAGAMSRSGYLDFALE
jgi:hypothetical protein